MGHLVNPFCNRLSFISCFNCFFITTILHYLLSYFLIFSYIIPHFLSTIFFFQINIFISFYIFCCYASFCNFLILILLKDCFSNSSIFLITFFNLFTSLRIFLIKIPGRCEYVFPTSLQYTFHTKQYVTHPVQASSKCNGCEHKRYAALCKPCK